MNAVFAPSAPRGSVRVPASKSCAHRLLICAAFAEGESVVRNVSFSEDIRSIACARWALNSALMERKFAFIPEKETGKARFCPAVKAGARSVF